jgi:hypothetical protein
VSKQQILALELYNLRIEFTKLKNKMVMVDETMLLQLAHLNEAILRKADELARAVLDEAKQSEAE